MDVGGNRDYMLQSSFARHEFSFLEFSKDEENHRLGLFIWLVSLFRSLEYKISRLAADI